MPLKTYNNFKKILFYLNIEIKYCSNKIFKEIKNIIFFIIIS